MQPDTKEGVKTEEIDDPPNDIEPLDNWACRHIVEFVVYGKNNVSFGRKYFIGENRSGALN